MQFKECYQNPFIEERADPYITLGPDGFYYFTASYPMKSADDVDGYDRIVLRRAKEISELASADEITIWKVTDRTLTHRFIWAPELHYIAGRWYVFYAGSEDKDNNWAFDCHVLVCDSIDPYTGNWSEKGKFQKREDDDFSFTGFSLDMTYFEDGEHSYVIWAQHSLEKISCLYLGEVNREEPWKLISLPMLLTEPEYEWEKVRYAVNEGPAVVKHNGRIMVFFSASGTGPEYCVGVISAGEGSNLLKKESWTKKDTPVLTSDDLHEEFGPGHNSFTKDKDGNDIFVYHARSLECFEGRCGYSENDPLHDPCRHARLKKIIWD